MNLNFRLRRTRTLLFGLAAIAVAGQVYGETVLVQYRGPVDLTPFACEAINRSSFVNRVCYDKATRYMLISLRGAYYHYCRLPPSVVASLLQAESIGRHYNANIKGKFDCRQGGIPAY